MTVEQVGTGIIERGPEYIDYSVADPAIFAKDGGPSMASRFADKKVYFRRAKNKRTSTEATIGGWDQMRDRLDGLDGKPMLFFFDTCLDSIRTIPALQHDQNKAEDLDTKMEDHAADECRYACMSRPWTKPKPSEKAKKPDYNEFETIGEETGWRIA